MSAYLNTYSPAELVEAVAALPPEAQDAGSVLGGLNEGAVVHPAENVEAYIDLLPGFEPLDEPEGDGMEDG